MSLLDSMRQSLSLDASGIPSRRPRSPSLNHNVKQPAERRISRLISTIVTASQQQPRSSVGAGYRSGVSACQTLKSPKKRFFSGACGCSPGNPRRAARAPHIDARAPAATTKHPSPRPAFDPQQRVMLQRAILGPKTQAFPHKALTRNQAG